MPNYRAAAINIKNPETCKLAKQVAQETGESLTTAIHTALRERLDRLHVEGTKRDESVYTSLVALGKRGAELAPGPYPDADGLLYDENGLPI